MFMLAALHGSSAMLLKSSSRRRRSKLQILADKQAEIDQLSREKDQALQLEKLQDKIILLEQQVHDHKQSSEVVTKLLV